MTSIVEVDQFDETVTAPDNGELIVGASATDPPPPGEGPVRPPFQRLSNRTAFIRNRDLEASLIPRVTLGAAADSMTCFGIGKIWLRDPAVAGRVVSATHSNTAINAATLPTLDSWYYFYLYYSAGSVLMEASTTVPTADLSTKTGNNTRRYVGAVYLYDSGGGVGAFVSKYQVRGHTVNQSEATTDTNLIVVNAAAGTGAWVSATCAGKVPPHVVRADLACKAVMVEAGGGAIAPKDFQIQQAVLGAPYRVALFTPYAAAGQTQIGYGILREATLTINAFNWQLAVKSGANTHTATIGVSGYYE